MPPFKKQGTYFIGYCPNCGERIFATDTEIQVEDYVCCGGCEFCGTVKEFLSEAPEHDR